MSRNHRLGRSLAVASVAILLVAGAAFAQSSTFSAAPAGTWTNHLDTLHVGVVGDHEDVWEDADDVDAGEVDEIDDGAQEDIDDGDQDEDEDGDQDEADAPKVAKPAPARHAEENENDDAQGDENENEADDADDDNDQAEEADDSDDGDHDGDNGGDDEHEGGDSHDGGDD